MNFILQLAEGINLPRKGECIEISKYGKGADDYESPPYGECIEI